MALLASTINGAGYVLSNGEDKDNGNGFEFMRRKRWPQLLMQEMVGSALFCIKPTINESSSGDTVKGGTSYRWKVMLASPSVEDMIGLNPQALEGKDFMEIVHSSDQSQLQKFFTHLLAPHPSPHNSESSTSTMTSMNTPPKPIGPIATSSKSQTAYIRVNKSFPVSNTRRGSATKPSSGSGSGGASGGERKEGHVVWEIRAHATGVEKGEMDEKPGDGTTGNFGVGANGTVMTQAGQGQKEGGSSEVELKGTAIWVMGRAVGEGNGENEGNSQSLDAFLELKLENEKLREELRELQQEYGEDDIPLPAYLDRSPSRPSISHLGPSSSSPSDGDDASTSSPSSSTPSSPGPSNLQGHLAQSASAAGGSIHKPRIPSSAGMGGGPGRPGRPPKDREAGATRDKKKPKKMASNPQFARVQASGEVGEGMHVCVTCGRTDSPEWRKGPLGPKTLCNACGLRWAKRNSSAPTRKDRKAK